MAQTVEGGLKQSQRKEKLEKTPSQIAIEFDNSHQYAITDWGGVYYVRGADGTLTK